MREAIHSDNAPAAVGPYSQAIRHGNMIFTSGQISLDPASGDLIGNDIKTQTEQVLENLSAVLESAGVDFNQVVKTTCFLNDMSDFAAFNEVYQQYFTGTVPARSCVAVDRLPKDALVEVEAIVII